MRIFFLKHHHLFVFVKIDIFKGSRFGATSTLLQEIDGAYDFLLLLLLFMLLKFVFKEFVYG